MVLLTYRGFVACKVTGEEARLLVVVNDREEGEAEEGVKNEVVDTEG